MSLETIVFEVNGKALNFIRCSLTASAEEAVRTAEFDVRYSGNGLPCAPNDEAVIKISGELWGTGYVRDVMPEHSENERGCIVTFVSRTCDATECSILHETGLAENVDLAGIAQEFDALGIGIEADAKSSIKRIHKVEPGETLFRTLEPDAKAQGVLIYDTPEGKLKLADKPEGRHAGTLKRGENIKRARGNLSGRYSYDAVTVRGQASAGTDANSLRPEATAGGLSKRPRPLLKVLYGEATSGRLKKRAEWEARRAAGKGISCEIITAGMRDTGGKIWSPNWMVEVDDDWIGIEQDMTIASLTLDQDSNGGTQSTLTLKDPRALGGDNPHGSSSGAWSAPAPKRIEFKAI